MPATVISRLQRFFVEHKVQPYGAFALSKQAGEEMDESYAAIAELINAAPEEITIGPSTTLNLYVLAQSLRHLLRPGDEIIVTNQDHEVLVNPLKQLFMHIDPGPPPLPVSGRSPTLPCVASCRDRGGSCRISASTII